MIPAVVTDPASGNPVVVASLERQRVEVEKEIKEACSEFLNEPDWNKNMGIVDKLNRSPYLCPFAIKEIRKQLKTKNPEIEILALQLTETIIKNCPSSHAAVAQEDFMRYLVKVGTNQRQGGKWTQMTTKLKKKKTTINSKHVRSQCIEKALLILKMLAIAYDESHLYPVFKQTYKTLQKQNVRFPETNKDESLNIFSPMHSSGAPDEWGGGPTAMGSVQNVALPMIRPIKILEDVYDQTLIQAQESAQLLFQMINAPVLSYELIPDLTQMLNQSQQQIVVMISEGNAPEKVLQQALEVNDLVNQVLEDAQAIANGTKRRYQEEVNVKNLLLQSNDSENPVKDKDDNKDPNDDEPSLEHSISIGDGENDNDDALLSLSGPAKDKLAKKRGSKKAKRQSLDLLGMGGDKDKGVIDLMSSENTKIPPKKEESEEDLMGFLGIQPENEKPPKPAPPTVFDPLEDPTLNNNNNNNGISNKIPPPAYMDPMDNGYMDMNNNNNNNGNVFRQNNGNNMNAMNNMNNNNGNVFRENNNNGMNNMNNNNNNNNGNKQNGNPGHRKLNTIQRGNESVLNVLTGEVSPSPSYPNSSNSSIKATPKQKQSQQPPKQEYNLGSTPSKPTPNNNNGNTKITKGNDFDTGNDPFADMDDPFADMGGASFDDVMGGNNGNAKSPPKPAQQTQPKPQPKAQPKAQPKVDDNDPFADMAGNAFDDPALNMIADEPQKQESKPKPKPKPQQQPKPHQVQDSNDIILNMFEAGASPDPNQNKSILKPAPQQKKDDNPFGIDDSNPFGASTGDNGNDANPFDALDNPFGSDGVDPNNPFAMPSNGGNKKQDDFMGDRDPFADM